MLANPVMFPFAGPSDKEKEQQAWEEAKGVKKSELALARALTADQWIIPRYIREGLIWLAESDVPSSPATVLDKVAV